MQFSIQLDQSWAWIGLGEMTRLLGPITDYFLINILFNYPNFITIKSRH